jgi:fructokinase
MSSPTAPRIQPDIDFLGIGELLIDFIAEEKGVSLDQVRAFGRYMGGSPANIAINVARLGGRSAMISRIGRDPFGHFLQKKLQTDGVLVDFIHIDADAPTSIVFITRGASTPEFFALRGADMRLSRTDVPPQLIARSRIVHASAFALASESARQAIGFAFGLAHQQGKIISLDPNYSPQLWPDRDEALQVLASLYPLVTFTKPSLDDARRLFGEGYSPGEYIDRFHKLGAATVVLSMGTEGVLLSDGHAKQHIATHQLSVVDATGAGDAFWAGFLMALLDKYPLRACVQIGQMIAEIKLQRIGPLPKSIDRHQIYSQWAMMET